jgi:hypothetical protein
MLKNFENFPRFVIFRIAFIPIPDIIRAWQATETCRNKPARKATRRMKMKTKTTISKASHQHNARVAIVLDLLSQHRKGQITQQEMVRRADLTAKGAKILLGDGLYGDDARVHAAVSAGY